MLLQTTNNSFYCFLISEFESHRIKDTGCGKTTVVQLISVLLNRNLQIVNCHASTETSDLLGGLRPTRARNMILQNLVLEVYKILEMTNFYPSLQSIEIPKFLSTCKNGDSQTTINFFDRLPSDAANQIITFVKQIQTSLPKLNVSASHNICDSLQTEKKRKLENGSSQNISSTNSPLELISNKIQAIVKLHQKYVSLFEWIDGPLVNAMKNGDLFLLDEMSLAEDAVLERLNSVLEPSRTLTLAEKGGDLPDEEFGEGSVIIGHENFIVFATMNPGGDFGKRELSPALRSRFTEIWVPAVTDCSDIDLVLEQSLSSSHLKKVYGEIEVSGLKEAMICYVNWFNNDICANQMSTCCDFFLSLRDVLAWARFIIETNVYGEEMIGLWAGLIHGAALMHLDGLGLGTGLTSDDAAVAKKDAKEFLLKQIPKQVITNNVKGFADEMDGLDEKQLINNDSFGIRPFLIPVGPLSTVDVGFKLNAPTTALNLRRVLRAMQISKPILLEGSPGVGKTSLISALASMSGHNLIRINLSEQTEITDLMGSDLPIPNEGNDSGASFQWCDGALLRAIKNGDWVLLDELNLASQSVLEGLNSCLDHRASVYIPELGATFQCPPTFRIFAAQNPLAQGGGRKGLPKSFLNRFTKVYVEALTENDLHGIVSSKFQMIPEESVKDIVKFNSAVQRDIDNRHYGQSGSPWEFNLRDVFRWCELILNHYNQSGTIDCGIFADTIYMQRLRSENDRELLLKRYEQCFGDISWFAKTRKLCISDESVEIGNAKVERNREILISVGDMLLGFEQPCLRSLLRPMEAVTFCIQMKWPCLLVGPPSSGKSTVLKTLAESCNVKLEEIVLTPSSDVNELIGTFEQIDASEVGNRLLNSLQLLLCHAFTTLIKSSHRLAYVQRMNKQYVSLQEKMHQKQSADAGCANVFNQPEILSKASDLLQTAIEARDISTDFYKSTEFIIQSAQKDLQHLTEAEGARNSTVNFRWADGILVSALEKGHWLHLENVNLCSSSVLDRLNPLMESDGVLVLTECGIQENGKHHGKPRIVKPHANFRLFLSTNPSFGEISRAMRNRCIEVSFLAPLQPKKMDILPNKGSELVSSIQTIDHIDLMEKVGIASPTLAKKLIDVHLNEVEADDCYGEDNTISRSFKEISLLSCDSSNRGFVGGDAFTKAVYISYGLFQRGLQRLHESETCGKNDLLIHTMENRNFLAGAVIESTASNNGCLVRAVESSFCIPLGLSNLGHNLTDSNGKLHLLDQFAPIIPNCANRLAEVKSFLVANFASTTTELDCLEKFHFILGCSKSLQNVLSYIVTKLLCGFQVHEEIRALLLDSRLAIINDEYDVYERIVFSAGDLDVKTLSVIESSFAIFEGKIDRTHINHPIIPFLYPLFRAIDALLEKMASDPGIVAYLESINRFVSCRDRLWLFLKSCDTHSDSSRVEWSVTNFLVHWGWFKKALMDLQFLFEIVSYSDMKAERRKVNLIVSSIDQELLINSPDSHSLSNKFWKTSGHPLVPASATDWISIDVLRNSDRADSLSENLNFNSLLSGNRKPIKLQHFIDGHHSYLILDENAKLEILGALCMAYWTTTDEMKSSTRKEKKNYEIAEVTDLLVNKMKSASQDLSALLHVHAVDTSVHLESNKLDVEDLEKLKVTSKGNFEDKGISLIHNLLHSFAKVQLMPAVEFWCVKEENWIIENLAALMILKSDAVPIIQTSIIPRIKRYIGIVIDQTMWPVADLRPLQTLVWALESPHASIDDFRHLFRCLYSPMLVNATKHHWSNSFNDLPCISDALISPPFWCSEAPEEGVSNGIEETFGNDMGSARLRHCVVTASIFRLLGYNEDTFYPSRKYPYRTLENYEVREMQSKKLVQFLSKDLTVLTQNSSLYNIQVFFLENILNSLKDSFEDDHQFRKLQSYVLGQGELTTYSFCFNFRFFDHFRLIG